jgi:hypothetical protein
MSPERASRLLLEDLAQVIETDLAVLDRAVSEISGVRDAMASAPGKLELAFIAVELSRYYGAVEHVLEAVERTLADLPPKSDRWHRELLDAAARPRSDVRPEVLRPDTARGLHEILGFRHFLRHAYAVDLRWEGHLERHTANLSTLHAAVARDLRTFAAYLRAAAKKIDPPE